MIGCDRIAAFDRDPRSMNRFNRFGLRRQVDEERRFLNIGAVGVPFVDRLVGAGDGVPLRIPIIDIPILFDKQAGAQAVLDGIDNFLLRRPNILQIDILAVMTLANRLLIQIDIDRAGQGIGNHQRRRRQEVGADIGANPPAKVAIAA